MPKTFVTSWGSYEEQPPNYSGFVVIGAGLPRTGTMSLRSALGILLDGAVYNMLNVHDGTEVDWQHWEKAFEEGVSKEEWIEFFDKRGFRASVDFPSALFYR